MSTSSAARVEEEIRSFVTGMLGTACGPDADLKGLGLDSIGFLELAIFIEKRFSIPLPLEIIAAGSPITPSRIATLLTAGMQQHEAGTPS
jgi:acyl carrier protein